MGQRGNFYRKKAHEMSVNIYHIIAEVFDLSHCSRITYFLQEKNPLLSLSSKASLLVIDLSEFLHTGETLMEATFICKREREKA